MLKIVRCAASGRNLLLLWALVCFAGATSAGAAPSTTDPFQGATVDGANSDIFSNGSYGSPSLFDGDPSFQNIYYNDKSPRTAGDTYTTTFSTAAPVTISGVSVYVWGDSGNDSNRSVGSFEFQYFNGTNFVSLGSFNPDDDFTEQTLTFNVPSVTAQTFRAISLPVSPNYYGPRLLEIDAVAVPEPASVALLGIMALGCLARRRRI